MTGAKFPPQWEGLLKNSGVWEGSFTNLSSRGELLRDTPSCVSLEAFDQGQAMRQTIRKYAPGTGALLNEQVLEYRSLARSVLFFESGHFSQGSLQYGPFSEFGAEMGFIAGDRRMRLVILFDTTGVLSGFTLIREHRHTTPLDERPTLTVEQLVGRWQGQGITLYPDWRPAESFHSTLLIERDGDRLVQTLQAPSLNLRSTATIEENRLLFQDQPVPVQVCLLPDGASANSPLNIPKRQPLRLEAGWLIQPDLRQRLIRSYDAQGSWVSLTLLTEIRTR